MNTEQHEKLKTLFQQARDCPFAERDTFAVKACGDDTTLLEELRALLRHDHSRTLVPPASKPLGISTATDTATSGSIRIRPSTVRRISSVHVALLASAATLIVILSTAIVLYRSVGHRVMKSHAAQLQSQCETTATAITNLLDANLKLAESWATDVDLAAAIKRANQDDLRPEERTLEQICPQLCQNLKRQWGDGFTCVVWNREQMKTLFTENNLNAVNSPATQTGAQLLNQVLGGRPMVYLPNALEPISQEYPAKSGQNLMSYVVPIRAAEGGKVVGAMLVRNHALAEQFHATFAGAFFLESGECYAFTADARMISRPRFLQQLQELGLMETLKEFPSTVYVSLRDPGGDLTEGYRSTESRQVLPETELVRRSRAESSGVQVQGYRDYRGRRVIGAWQWIDRYDFGVALEIDEAEIQEPYRAWNTAFLAMGGLTMLATGWVVVSQWLTRRQSRSTGNGPRRIGPYQIEKPIGEGGMGHVFKAQHDLLKRPTALKLLKPELVTETAIRRFMREVQCASQLHHPNTVDIYDYGCTEDGQFYYAMEYLFGLSLQELVRTFGPLPYARGLYVLRQLCGSLGEAHRAGFVHRDIKPQNIMICNCGGEADFVKVVDFGLVKSSDTPQTQGDTTHGEWAGTPRYIAPERLLQPRLVDPRSDIYSVGVTMYWALTRTDAFDGDGLDGLMAAILSQSPRPMAPELRIPDALQAILVKCLAKVASDRYQSIEELQAALDAVPNPQPWTPAAALKWWQTHLPDLSEVTPLPVTDPTPSSEKNTSS